MKKKRTFLQTYKSGSTVMKTEVEDRIKKAQIVYIKDQKMYDDGSQSVTVEIHYKLDKSRNQQTSKLYHH